jgi:L-threonylcarbamoyladenylate synthase
MAKTITINPQDPEPAAIQAAVDVLRAGELVVLPTETVYGLAACLGNPQAVRRVFEVKGRPVTEPLPVQVASIAELAGLAARIPREAEQVLGCFAPGPLTLILEAVASVPESVTAGTGKVGIRIPADPVVRAVLAAIGEPLVVTSANRHGQAAPIDARGVADELGDSIALILDAGRSRLAQESTVLDVTRRPPVILRQGALSRAELEAVVGPVG